MEQHLGRQLDPDLEVVHHKNEDYSDDRIENLEILTRKKHSELHAKHDEVWEFECPNCQTRFERRISRWFKRDREAGKAGPFCGKSCAAKYTTRM